MKEQIIDGRRFKVWALPHPLLVHWIVNPGIAFNELALGQRIPKQIFIEQDVEGSLIDRQYLRCEACGEMTSYRVYKDAGLMTGLYHGIPCMHCEANIPMLSNFLTGLVEQLSRPWTEKHGTAKRDAKLAKQRAKLKTAAMHWQENA